MIPGIYQLQPHYNPWGYLVSHIISMTSLIRRADHSLSHIRLHLAPSVFQLFVCITFTLPFSISYATFL